ncbi:hypothetical protein TSMEX_006755 [Taenia solium]|eukprot:TsM_000315800 transcript=TsM_000315800 gene=TsM_000315800
MALNLPSLVSLYCSGTGGETTRSNFLSDNVIASPNCENGSVAGSSPRKNEDKDLKFACVGRLCKAW